MDDRSPVTALARLDNPVWHALHGPQANVAEGLGQAVRFPPAVSVFGAVPDDPTPAAWADLARLVGPGQVAVVFRRSLDVPDGWTCELQLPTVQMVWGDPTTPPPVGAPDADELNGDDRTQVDEMLDLVARCQPGPFAARTATMGTYLGVRRRGRLIAMAGERLHIEGGTEVSAVCTDAEHRGEGLATHLVGELVARIQRRGERPFLHAATTNRGAIEVYRRLGFVVRTQVQAALLRAPEVTERS